VSAAFGLKFVRTKSAVILISVLAASTAIAQQGQVAAEPNSTSSLRLPQNPTVFGQPMPAVIKATAIVNGDVITQTDINERAGLLPAAQGGQIPPEEMDRVRQQVLRNLIDETLQIQAAKAEKIEIRDSDIDKTVARVARQVKRSPEQLDDYLASTGSSMRSLRRQIEGEIAWQRLRRRAQRNIASERSSSPQQPRTRLKPMPTRTRSWSSSRTAHHSLATPVSSQKRRPLRLGAISVGFGPSSCRHRWRPCFGK
jgi:peptidyl-prolyl cis-trans isomerase SurA